jgi:hypothetical protein
MAVSPKMSEIIFNCILKTFAGIRYDYIGSNLKTPNLEKYEQLEIGYH